MEYSRKEQLAIDTMMDMSDLLVDWKDKIDLWQKDLCETENSKDIYLEALVITLLTDSNLFPFILMNARQKEIEANLEWANGQTRVIDRELRRMVVENFCGDNPILIECD